MDGQCNRGRGWGMNDPTVVPERLRTDDDSGLVATGFAQPKLSWNLSSNRPGARQVGYEVEVDPAPDFANPVRSGYILAPRVVHNPWPGAPLGSRDVRYWRVRVTTDVGLTDWSAPGRVEASLLTQDDWIAKPIALPSDIGRKNAGPVP